MSAEIINLRSDPMVTELFKKLNDSKTEMPEFTAILNYVDAIEKQLQSVIDELQGVKQSLETAHHPQKSMFNTMITNLEIKVDEMRQQISDLKQSVIESIKNVLDAIKAKGMSALNGVMKFFKVQEGLDALRDDLDNAKKSVEKVASKLETLEKTVSVNKARKPSLLKQLEANKAIVAARDAVAAPVAAKNHEVTL